MNTLYRYDMIQACIDVVKKRKKKVNYVEIGVQTGYCFFKIKADRKLAVDPNFIIKPTRKIKAYIKNFSNFNNEFFELTSDDFFEQKKSYLEKIGGIDVIFIDGLHLYEQVTKDIENALRHLNEGGFILAHDCNPLSETAAVRAYTSEEVAAMNLPGWNNTWNGDGWKSVVEIRAKYKNLDVKVFNTDHGVGVITKGTPEKVLDFDPEQVEALTYADLDKNREEFLNLKAPEEFSRFISNQ
ncbi:MAG: class I SAM-dependent methyltransferase [Sphingobacteriaceae bacterium]|nr:MAG: class I SAM-dependent methyltransferase [Sphingobacteriaceae bacterium]